MTENKTAKEMFEELGYKCFDNHPEAKESLGFVPVKKIKKEATCEPLED